MASVPQGSDRQLRAAIYTRVSTLEQGQRGYSLDAQTSDCRKLAEELGVSVVGEFSDQDSGASWDLPGLNAILDAAKRRDFDILLCYDPDRLARRMAKQLVIEEELSRASVSIRYVTLRLGDTAEDALLKNVRSSIAEYERTKIAMRTSRGRRAKAEQGLIVGNGYAPFGYRFVRAGDKNRVVGLEPDPDTAPVAQRIFRDLATTPIYVLCNRLNAEGVPTYTGRAREGWRNGTIVAITRNPVYRGMAAYGRRDRLRGYRPDSEWLTVPCPPIVTPEEYEAALDGLAHRKRARPSRNPDRDSYLLRGLLNCGHCGHLLSCIPNNGLRYYVCSRTRPSLAAREGWTVCDAEALPAEPAETDCWTRVSGVLLVPETLAAGLHSAEQAHRDATERQGTRVTTIEREIADARKRLARTIDAQLDAESGSEIETAMRQRASELEALIGRLHVGLAELTAQPSPGLAPEQVESLKAFASKVAVGLEHAGFADRRRVLELLRLRGNVRVDPDHGVKMGRRHRFVIDWEALVELSAVGNASL